MAPLSMSLKDLTEKRRQNLFDDAISGLKNIKTQLLSCTRDGLIDIDDKNWNKIEEKLKELGVFIDELNKDKFKICGRK